MMNAEEALLLLADHIASMRWQVDHSEDSIYRFNGAFNKVELKQYEEAIKVLERELKGGFAP